MDVALSTLESRSDAQGRRLQVRFGWEGDRFVHAVRLIGGEGCDAGEPILLATVAADLNSDWPDSPPLQQLDRCPLAAGTEGIVGVGMAGRSHWSLAVEPHETGLKFDFACRFPAGPGPLGCTYAAHAGSFQVDAQGGWLAFPSGAGMRVVVDPHETLVEWERATSRLRFSPQRWAEQRPATARWTYLLMLGRGEGTA